MPSAPRRVVFRALLLVFALVSTNALAQAPSARQQRQEAIEFHLRAQQRTGVLVPLYLYPANIHQNAAFNRLMEIKRRYEIVPIWVILNPASGPGKSVDANYVKAIDRLQGAGCVTLGYVTTSYGKRTEAGVRHELEQWRTMYPRIQGIFFDEMIYEDIEAGAAYQAALTAQAHVMGFWPTVANPGAETPGRYFAANAADVIVVHEGNAWPAEERLHGDYFGGYSDYPPFTRAVLLHSQPSLDSAALKMVRKYTRWIYVTEDPYRPGDPHADNPWDSLSRHLEALCAELAKG